MTFPTSGRDAADQIARAREAALAWLRATLASLPAAVTSLSVGAEFTDANDQPAMEPRLNASLRCRNGAVVPYPGFPSDLKRNSTAPGWAEVDAIADDLRTHTATFLFALGDEEWLMVTRADLATAVFPPGTVVHFAPAPPPIRHAIPVACSSTAEADVYRAIMQEIVDLPRGEATSLRIRRGADGALTWAVTEP